MTFLIIIAAIVIAAALIFGYALLGYSAMLDDIDKQCRSTNQVNRNKST